MKLNALIKSMSPRKKRHSLRDKIKKQSPLEEQEDAPVIYGIPDSYSLINTSDQELDHGRRKKK